MKRSKVRLALAKNIHGNKYDYSNTVYVAGNVAFTVRCKIHGEFGVTPDKHLNSRCGCPKCVIRVHDTPTFVTRAKEVHGVVYGYDNAIYVNNTTPLSVWCECHGLYSVTPATHLRGAGCRRCVLDERRHLAGVDYIKQAIHKFGDKYTYDDLNYTNAKGNVTIGCPEHGDVTLSAKTFLRAGCGKCERKRLNFMAFVVAANSYYGKYKYNEEQYHGALVTMDVICPDHGLFRVTPNAHLSGYGCGTCKLIKWFSIPGYLRESNKIHQGLYKHYFNGAVNMRSEIVIRCYLHGEYRTTCSEHLAGTTCTGCKQEIERIGKEALVNELKRAKKHAVERGRPLTKLDSPAKVKPVKVKKKKHKLRKPVFGAFPTAFRETPEDM